MKLSQLQKSVTQITNALGTHECADVIVVKTAVRCLKKSVRSQYQNHAHISSSEWLLASDDHIAATISILLHNFFQRNSDAPMYRGRFGDGEIVVRRYLKDCKPTLALRYERGDYGFSLAYSYPQVGATIQTIQWPIFLDSEKVSALSECIHKGTNVEIGYFCAINEDDAVKKMLDIAATFFCVSLQSVEQSHEFSVSEIKESETV